MNASPERAEEQYPNADYAWYVVGLLTLVYVFSFIDRQILNLLVRPIRRDLGISDTQMSLLPSISKSGCAALTWNDVPPLLMMTNQNRGGRRVQAPTRK